jgi:hypothetical protein
MEEQTHHSRWRSSTVLLAFKWGFGVAIGVAVAGFAISVALLLITIIALALGLHFAQQPQLPSRSSSAVHSPAATAKVTAGSNVGVAGDVWVCSPNHGDSGVITGPPAGGVPSSFCAKDALQLAGGHSLPGEQWYRVPAPSADPSFSGHANQCGQVVVHEVIGYTQNYPQDVPMSRREFYDKDWNPVPNGQC